MVRIAQPLVRPVLPERPVVCYQPGPHPDTAEKPRPEEKHIPRESVGTAGARDVQDNIIHQPGAPAEPPVSPHPLPADSSAIRPGDIPHLATAPQEEEGTELPDSRVECEVCLLRYIY